MAIAPSIICALMDILKIKCDAILVGAPISIHSTYYTTASESVNHLILTLPRCKLISIFSGDQLGKFASNILLAENLGCISCCYFFSTSG